MILVIDFGSQTAHLIARRLRDLGAIVHLTTPDLALEFVQKEKPQGIILSGGPLGVYEKDTPSIDKKVFDLGIPILGICYGFMITAHLLGGKVISGKKEYGPAPFEVFDDTSKILRGIPVHSTVWMNHGDEIIEIPKGFTLIGSTPHVPKAAIENEKEKMYMILFHPEVEHTEFGKKILENFLEICGIHFSPPLEGKKLNPDQIISQIKKTIGDSPVIGAVSGGVDSTVAGILVAKAVGKKFTPIFVDNGLMRDDAKTSVQKIFKDFGTVPIVVNVREEMLERLKGITDSEEKRKIIGKFYIEVFELRARIARAEFLMQGTIYSDVIESQGSKHASKIKSHHNVGGLPKEMKFNLIEPLRELYKDEVRKLGRKIGLPKEFVMKQPFPGPGFAVRIRGEVTEKRLEQEKQADSIVLDELKKAGILENIFISFPVMTEAYSTAVKGDAKFFGEVIALRVIESNDVMTAIWSRLPYDVLQRISSRIVNEVPEISRIVYDITTKPPATMEWE